MLVVEAEVVVDEADEEAGAEVYVEEENVDVEVAEVGSEVDVEEEEVVVDAATEDGGM